MHKCTNSVTNYQSIILLPIFVLSLITGLLVISPVDRMKSRAYFKKEIMKTQKYTLTLEKRQSNGDWETIQEFEIDVPARSRVYKIKRVLLRLINMNKLKFMISAILIAMLITVIALLC
jgi:hypothetical protein